MGGHFPTVQLDNTIWFSALFRVSGFLWHNFKCASQFGCFLQYLSGIEVLGCYGGWGASEKKRGGEVPAVTVVVSNFYIFPYGFYKS